MSKYFLRKMQFQLFAPDILIYLHVGMGIYAKGFIVHFLEQIAQY